jgi:hypothetical protein
VAGRNGLIARMSWPSFRSSSQTIAANAAVIAVEIRSPNAALFTQSRTAVCLSGSRILSGTKHGPRWPITKAQSDERWKPGLVD